MKLRRETQHLLHLSGRYALAALLASTLILTNLALITLILKNLKHLIPSE